jgi:hypothetical protein
MGKQWLNSQNTLFKFDEVFQILFLATVANYPEIIFSTFPVYIETHPSFEEFFNSLLVCGCCF